MDTSQSLLSELASLRDEAHRVQARAEDLMARMTQAGARSEPLDMSAIDAEILVLQLALREVKEQIDSIKPWVSDLIDSQGLGATAPAPN